MSLSTSDVSVLIPAFGRLEMTRNAVRSALATDAGEVVVSEDASGSDMSALAEISDSRFRMVVQPENLGLWRNHLALLRSTRKPWVKFLQSDDNLAPDCVEKMCAAASPETTVVGALPVYRNLDTGEVEERYRLTEPMRWATGEYVNRMARVGNELGRPSYTLFRRDALLETEEAWRNDMSCDLVANVIAAARGEVVLLPQGLVTCGIHKQRDGATQPFELLSSRLINSMAFLSRHPDHRVQRFTAIYGLVESMGLARVFMAKRRRGHDVSWRRFATDLLQLMRLVKLRRALRYANQCRQYMRYKYTKTRPILVGDF